MRESIYAFLDGDPDWNHETIEEAKIRSYDDWGTRLYETESTFIRSHQKAEQERLERKAR